MTYYMESQIVDEYEICPYCGDMAKRMSCCGEVHFEDAYEFEDGEVYSVESNDFAIVPPLEYYYRTAIQYVRGLFK